MANRSPSTRLGWTSFASAACAAIVSLFAVGCQSGGQYDQVARELRMQEDELYALEDYLDQYQKLVCKYRSENATLKRQLAENGVAPATERSRTMNGTRSTPRGPNMDVAPPAEVTPPPPDVDAPDIPPLEETTSYDSRAKARGRKSRNRVKQVSAEGAGKKKAAVRAVAFEPVKNAPIACDVWLHGEVVANETGGGPRVAVEVEPLDAEGRAMNFEGALSLMLMAPDENGGQASVARWDYRPQDVRAAADGSGKIRFHVELPADAPTSDGMEMWVRLVQRRGAKLLAHAEIKLHEPSLFSSRLGEAADGVILPDVGTNAAPKFAADEDAKFDGFQVDEESLPQVAAAGSEMFDGGWTIARPGQPAGMPAVDEDAKSSWRATLELPPSVTASSAPTKPKPRVNRPRERVDSREVAKAKKPVRATWSPDRSASAPGDSLRTATRPTWSATR